MSLHQKIVKIRQEMPIIPANGVIDMGGGQSYNYVRFKDAAPQVQKLLDKYGIAIYPTGTKKMEPENYLRKTYTKESKFSGEASFEESKYRTTHIIQKFAVVDAETGEKMECGVPGSGFDAGQSDKMVSKALTSCQKYLYQVLFGILNEESETDSQAPEDITPEDVIEEIKKRTSVTELMEYGKKIPTELRSNKDIKEEYIKKMEELK